MSASDHQDREEGGETEAPKSKKHQHRKDKPWDDGTVDKWKVEEFKEVRMLSQSVSSCHTYLPPLCDVCIFVCICSVL